jgi:hypothetical protein
MERIRQEKEVLGLRRRTGSHRRSWMHDTKEGRSYQSGSGGRCHCGECIEFGCDCADTGSHDRCLCDRCGDGTEDVAQTPSYSFAHGAGHD